MSVKSLDAPAADNTVAAAPTGVTEFALRATPVAAANAP